MKNPTDIVQDIIAGKIPSKEELAKKHATELEAKNKAASQHERWLEHPETIQRLATLRETAKSAENNLWNLSALYGDAHKEREIVNLAIFISAFKQAINIIEGKAQQ